MKKEVVKEIVKFEESKTMSEIYAHDSTVNAIMEQITTNAIAGDTASINIASLCYELSEYTDDYVALLSERFDYAKSTIRVMRKVGDYINHFEQLVEMSYSRVQELTRIDKENVMEFLDMYNVDKLTIRELRDTIKMYLSGIEKEDDVTEYVTEDVTEYVTEDVTEYVTEDVTEDAEKGLYINYLSELKEGYELDKDDINMFRQIVKYLNK